VGIIRTKIKSGQKMKTFINLTIFYTKSEFFAKNVISRDYAKGCR